VGVSTKETDLADRHDHRTRQNKYITTCIYSPQRCLLSKHKLPKYEGRGFRLIWNDLATYLPPTSWSIGCVTLRNELLEHETLTCTRNDASEWLIRMRAWSSRNFMMSQTSKRRNTGSLFSSFLRWHFVKVCILHDIDAYFTTSCFDKILSKDFFL